MKVCCSVGLAGWLVPQWIRRRGDLLFTQCAFVVVWLAIDVVVIDAPGLTALLLTEGAGGTATRHGAGTIYPGGRGERPATRALVMGGALAITTN